MVLLLKNKNYENTTLVIFIFIFLMFLIIIFFISMRYIKIDRYSTISGIVYTDELVLLVVDDDERDSLYQNSNFYVDDKKIKYSINEDRGITMNKNSKDYYELLLKMNIDDKYKLNDVVDISIKIKGERIINILKLIWEDDNYN